MGKVILFAVVGLLIAGPVGAIIGAMIAIFVK